MGLSTNRADACLLAGDVAEVLTEVHRLDVATWGDTRTALVFRCVACASLKEGRAARLNTIAITLGLGLATVHNRMLKLAHWTDPETGEEKPLVKRVTDGYVLTALGEQLIQEWLTNLAKNARSATKSDFHTLYESLTAFDLPVGST